MRKNEFNGMEKKVYEDYIRAHNKNEKLLMHMIKDDSKRQPRGWLNLPSSTSTNTISSLSRYSNLAGKSQVASCHCCRFSLSLYFTPFYSSISISSEFRVICFRQYISINSSVYLKFISNCGFNKIGGSKQQLGSNSFKTGRVRRLHNNESHRFEITYRRNAQNKTISKQ